MNGIERKLLRLTPARVGVQLRVDQFADGRMTISPDPRLFALGRRRQTAAHHQQSVLVAAHITLDHHLAAFGIGQVIRRLDFRARHQLGGHAASMIPITGLDHHRQAYVFRRTPCIGGTVHDTTFGHRHAAGTQQTLGQVFVTRNRFGDGTGLIGLRRPDAMLARTVTQLHQIPFGQTYGGDTALRRRIDDACGRRPQTQGIDHVAQNGYGRRHIETAVLHRRQHQIARGMQRGTADLFVARAHHHFVHPAHPGTACFAETALHARQILQLDGDVFEDMTGPSAFA